MDGQRSAKYHRTETGKVSNEAKEAELATGPFSLLNSAVNSRQEVAIVCRDGRRLFAKVRSFDKHYNMLLMDVTELVRRTDSDFDTRNFPSLFLRGDTVVYVSPAHE